MTLQRFLKLGMLFGVSGGIDTVHDIVLHMDMDPQQCSIITRSTLLIVEAIGDYNDYFIYGLLREAITCDRKMSNWAAEEVAEALQVSVARIV